MRRGAAVVLLGALVMSSAAPASGGGESVVPPPNILIIVTDDQGKETMSAMPSTRSIFGSGTRFKNAVVTTPTCCPSRASIFTGRYAHNHGVLSNSAPLIDQDSTIQRYLNDAGYRTGIVGKYLNSWPTSENPPHFDEWALTKNRYYNYPANIDGEITTGSTYHTDFVEDQASLFLDESEDVDAEPWFLYLSPYAPHRPFVAEPDHETYEPKAWDGNPAVFENSRRDKPAWVRERRAPLRRVKRVRREQLQSLRSIDELVARTFAKIRALGEENTLAIFTSDNGLFWGEHGLSAKGRPYTRAFEVPFLVRWPGRVEGGRSRALAANIDIAPTVLDAAGLQAPTDGTSLLEPFDRRRFLLEHWRVIPDWAASRNNRIQYTEYYDDKGEIVFREFYNLKDDPWQLRNLLGNGDTSDDPSDAYIEWLSERLAAERRCEGADCP